MAADAASNAAARVRPSQEDLDRLDEPAADHTWHDKPELSKDRMKGKFHEYYKGNPKEDAKAAGSEGASEAHPGGSSDPRDLAGTAAREGQTGGSTGVNAGGGAATAADTLKQKVNENVDDDTKEKAKQRKEEYRRRVREYFNRKVPQERRDQVVWRFKVCRIPRFMPQTQANTVPRKWFLSVSSIPIMTVPSGLFSTWPRSMVTMQTGWLGAVPTPSRVLGLA